MFVVKSDFLFCFCFFSAGDLGHVTLTNSPQVEEGDSRFLASEVLHEVNMLCSLGISFGYTSLV